MEKLRVTVAEFCKIRRLKSHGEANNVMNFLKSEGIAVPVEKRKRPDGRGKPSTVYEIPQTVTLQLFPDSAIASKSVASATQAVEVEEEETAVTEVS